jgi:hypothetical protein
MTGKRVAQEAVVPTAFALVLAAVRSIGAVYLIDRYFGSGDPARSAAPSSVL